MDDPEYIPDSTSEQSIDYSNTDDDDDTEPDENIEPLTEDDIAEITIVVYEELEEYMKNNILSLASPKFYKDMTEYVTEIVFDIFIDAQAFDTEYEDNEDYDEVTEFVEQVADVFLHFYEIPIRSVTYTLDSADKQFSAEDIAIIQYKINALQNIPQSKQKTKEWYEHRYNLITASNLWKALGSESNQNSLIYEKCKPLDYSQSAMGSCNTESAMHWGIKYEPVTVQIYELMFQTKIGDFGCITHPIYPYIGASPDGINIDPANSRFGRMLEIKNIVNREITGIPKEEYWVQTQIQMDTCGLDECDFVETRFEEYQNETSFYEDTAREHRGIILYFIERTNSYMPSRVLDNSPKYRYMPSHIPIEITAICHWINQEKEEGKAKGLVLFSTIYWYLDEISCVLIPRNREWFRAAVPKIDAVWQTILKERVDGYEHRASKKRIAKINVTSDDASNSYMIQNMPVMNSFCLIRFDEMGNVI